MSDLKFELEAATPFADSLIWQLNRDYYEHHGIEAWRSQKVPHQITSNSMVGMTYAELIFGILKDVAAKNGTDHKVYILELGAGHGRLAYHLLTHLNRLIRTFQNELPSYCYILSDFAEENLQFFSAHPQFQKFFNDGNLDVAHFDAMDSREIHLRHSKTKIIEKDLSNPLITIANYFFDSIPVDLFKIQNGKIKNCSISLHTHRATESMSIKEKLENINIEIHEREIQAGHYSSTAIDKILNDYRGQLFDTYLLFPYHGLVCLDRLKLLSNSDMILLTIDKGQHELTALDNKEAPDMVTHGSMSMEVNFHALASYCSHNGGLVRFSDYSTLHLQLGCMIYSEEASSYHEMLSTYDRFVNNYGPDVFNTMKRFAYKHIATMNLSELIGTIRMSHFDSTVFIKLLPRIKQVMQLITRPDRIMLAQILDNVWKMYFTLNEDYDLAFEIGGMLYELAFYEKALTYFESSRNLYGNTCDEYYNRILCHYQLRQDGAFRKAFAEGKLEFPTFRGWAHIDQLDLTAE